MNQQNVWVIFCDRTSREDIYLTNFTSKVCSTRSTVNKIIAVRVPLAMMHLNTCSRIGRGTSSSLFTNATGHQSSSARTARGSIHRSSSALKRSGKHTPSTSRKQTNVQLKFLPHYCTVHEWHWHTTGQFNAWYAVILMCCERLLYRTLD